MSALGKTFVGLTGFLLLLGGYIYIFQDMMQREREYGYKAYKILISKLTARCSRPFVQIGDRCYFFSSNKAVGNKIYGNGFYERFHFPALLRQLQGELQESGIQRPSHSK